MREKGLCERVCFDGRGAYAAEWKEYRIVDDDELIAQVEPAERQSVVESDYRLAVSNALIEHWRTDYGYTDNDHVVIPCTLSSSKKFLLDSKTVDHTRNQSGFAPDDIVLVYAGSTAGWQSFSMLQELIIPFLENCPGGRMVFLSHPDENTDQLCSRFPDRVNVKWLHPNEVHSMLSACDHGILIREDSVTNRVASPTKFAEYLAAGLRVVITDHIGDMSQETRESDLGVIWNPGNRSLESLNRVSKEEKLRLAAYADSHYSKRAFSKQYEQLIARLA